MSGVEVVIERRRRERPDIWWLPFLWVILIPLVTVPLQVERLGSSSGFANASIHDRCELLSRPYESVVPGFKTMNTWRCDAKDVVGTLSPGLFNLAPLLLLGWPRRRTRLAALVAGGLGALRYFPGPNEAVVASLGLWVASVVLAILFPFVAPRDPSGSLLPGELRD
jgi:hypothetical protein